MTTIPKTETPGAVPRAWRFLQKPLHEKSRSFYVQWTRVFPKIPVPIRLPFGAWWLARHDFMGEMLSCDGFEKAECSFVERFLRPGMTVLDLGAHHGFYTLLASRMVGSRGRVVAFEPSRRERRALHWHLRLNRCRNVEVEALALGEENKDVDLYVVEARQSGCNSLRPPGIPFATSPERVHMTRLDVWLTEHKIRHIDFIKLDTEGGELAVLTGAQELLETRPRPVILAEIQDSRTKPWGYDAKEIITYLEARRFKWFCLLENGFVQELEKDVSALDGNYIACPEESISALGGFLRTVA